MNKNILVGGGAGLLVLALLAAFWISARDPEPLPPATRSAALGGGPSSGAAQTQSASAPNATPLQSATATAGAERAESAEPPGASRSTPWRVARDETKPTPEKKPLTRDERRAIRSEVRAKMAELLAKGQNATAEDAQAFVNDVEQLGQGVFDPRYFSTLRDMIAYSAESQALSKELAVISKSTKSEDLARQQAILSEMREKADRISNGAAALQSYARDVVLGNTP